MKTGSEDAERKLSILCVDDDGLALSNLADYVKDTGHNALSARSYEEAVAIIREREAAGTPLDAMITDYHLVGQSGRDLCEYVQSHHGYIHMLTITNDEELDISIIRKIGVYAHITKQEDVPGRISQLVDYVYGKVLAEQGTEW